MKRTKLQYLLAISNELCEPATDHRFHSFDESSSRDFVSYLQRECEQLSVCSSNVEEFSRFCFLCRIFYDQYLRIFSTFERISLPIF